MSLDSEFLRSIRHRQKFKERVSVTPMYLFEEKTRDIVKLMSRYFKQYKSCTEIGKDDFITWMNELKGDKMTSADRVLFDALMEDFEYTLSEAAEQFLTERLQESDLVYRSSDLLEKWANGDEIEIIDQLKVLVDKAAFTREDRDGIKQVKKTAKEILEHSSSTWGFTWPLPMMNKRMRPAQPGDMILVAARPESGKTTFLSFIIRWFMRHVDELYPGENRSILWLNNEGPGDRIKLRLIQSELGLTLTEMSQLADNGEDLDAMFEQSTGFSLDRIVILDIHNKNTAQVERKLEENNPVIIVWDMLDHVKYVSEDMGRQSRTDEYLEGLYKWVRAIGVMYDCVNMVSTQLSGDAENLQYPLLGMLKDSKTGKQGQADAIITFGFVNTYPNTRFIGLTKNKLNNGGGAGGRLGEVSFDGARGIMKEPEVEK